MKKTGKKTRIFIFLAVLMAAVTAFIYRVGHHAKMYSVRRY